MVISSLALRIYGSSNLVPKLDDTLARAHKYITNPSSTEFPRIFGVLEEELMRHVHIPPSVPTLVIA